MSDRTTPYLAEMLCSVWKIRNYSEIAYFILGAMSATPFASPVYDELSFLLSIIGMKEKLFKDGLLK